MNRTSALRSRAPNIDVRLASCIVGVTVSLPFNGSLDPVIFTVKIPNFEPANQYRCASWMSSNTLGFWSESGCLTLNSTRDNSTHDPADCWVTCHCYHLGNFAILEYQEPDKQQNLTFVLSTASSNASLQSYSTSQLPEMEHPAPGKPQNLTSALNAISSNALLQNCSTVQLQGMIDALEDIPFITGGLAQSDLQAALDMVQQINNNVPIATLAASQEAFDCSARFLKFIKKITDNVVLPENTTGNGLVATTEDYCLSAFQFPSDGAGISFTGISAAINFNNLSMIPVGSENLVKTGDFGVTLLLPASMRRYLAVLSAGSEKPVRGRFEVVRSSTLYNSTVTKESTAELGQSKSTCMASWIVGAAFTEPIHYWLDPNSSHRYKCTFWNTTARGGRGGWSNRRCYTIEIIDTYITCHCNHLTSFAILVDFDGAESALAQNHVLTALSTAALSLSIVGLMATVSLTILLRKCCGRGVSKHITDNECVILNLSIALLGGYVTFLGGIDRTSYLELCTLTGTLIHYFFLVSFAWEAVEGISLFRTFVAQNTFSGARTFRRKWTIVLCWCLPLLVVSINLLIDYTAYASSRACWLNAERAPLQFYITFIGPICVVISANLVIFVLIIHKLMFTHSKIRSTKSQTDLVVQFRRCATLCVLLGLPWIFLSINVFREDSSARIALHVLVAIFCGSQGVGIFFLQAFGLKAEFDRNFRHRLVTELGKLKGGAEKPTSSSSSAVSMISSTTLQD